MPPTDPAASSSPACVRRRPAHTPSLVIMPRGQFGQTAADCAAGHTGRHRCRRYAAMPRCLRLAGRNQPARSLVKKGRQRDKPRSDGCNVDHLAMLAPRQAAPHPPSWIRSLRIQPRPDSFVTRFGYFVPGPESADNGRYHLVVCGLDGDDAREGTLRLLCLALNPVDYPMLRVAERSAEPEAILRDSSRRTLPSAAAHRKLWIHILGCEPASRSGRRVRSER